MSTSTYKYDLKAGFSVFLLALPLCLGIAMASNFPPIAGVITAIVGGIISSFLGSSRLTIKGPAAGLIVIALGAVNDLGGGDLMLGYKKALAVGVVAAIIQIAFALFRWAKVAEIMPPSVIHGMLAAIGIIIISKQSHVAMGVKAQASKPLGLLAEIPHSFMNMNPEIFAIGLISFLIVVFWPKIKKLNAIPASIVVLLFAIPMTYVFDLVHPHTYDVAGHAYTVGPNFLINLPGQIISAVTFPDFSSITSTTSIKYIIMFALVGSIESLLTVCAIDNIDPEKRKSDLNKDLFSVGIGNLISSMLGGLPMISEIVRSKANIDYEAKTKKANIFHGIFLLLSVALVPWLLTKIPLAALAALLVFTGIRLASPSTFKHSLEIGVDQLILFVTTLVVTLLTDLLVGVGVGIALKIVLHFFRGVKPKDFFQLEYDKKQDNNETRLTLKGSLVFSNYLKLISLIEQELQDSSKVILDLSQTTVVDHTIQEKLETANVEALSVIGLDQHASVSGHSLSFKKHV